MPEKRLRRCELKFSWTGASSRRSQFTRTTVWTYQSLDSVEGSIQCLLFSLYPPFEATAPTVLGQLLQVIEGRYRGDALRCLLDFLVPAKHLLEAVQEAACAQYSDVVFVHEGWPLCLRDQVVLHLAPISPPLLRPGDFYLQVAPFCRQSARVVVRSLLAGGEGEGLPWPAVVEETPVPEACHRSIFTPGWLGEINRGRCGNPLSRCVLATRRGLVRLPWERVATPEFVDVSPGVAASMASAGPPAQPSSPDHPPLPHHLPSTASRSAADPPPPPPPCSPATKWCPSEPPPAQASSFSVQTRICPVRRGIAVSLRLVGSTTPSTPTPSTPATLRPSRPSRAKDTEPRPIGWVSPSMWDSQCSQGPAIDPGTSGPALEGETGCRASETGCREGETGWAKGETGLAGGETGCREGETGWARGETGCREGDTGWAGGETGCREGETGRAGAEAGPVKPAVAASVGEYLDVVQAAMLFGDAHPVTREGRLRARTASHVHAPTPMRVHDDVPLHTLRPQTDNRGIPVNQGPRGPGEARPPPPPPLPTQQPPALRPDPPAPREPPHCVRMVRISGEQPRQGGVPGPPEPRTGARHRTSYRAALRNPVAAHGRGEGRGGALTVPEEAGHGSLPGGGAQRPPAADGSGGGGAGGGGEDPWCHARGGLHVPRALNASGSPGEAGGAEGNRVAGEGYRQTSAMQGATQEASPHRTPPVTGANRVGAASSRERLTEGPHGPEQTPDLSCTESQWLAPASARTPGGTRGFSCPPEASSSASAPPSHQEATEPDRRCSSLSTAVVDTSEKCELVIVRSGHEVRPRERPGSCAEAVPRLHVVRCKNATAFGLVSPKLSRRTVANEESSGIPSSPVDGTSRPQRETLAPPKPPPPPPPETQRCAPPGSGRPRPDHLLLGPPDPEHHPLHLGVACLTGGKDRSGRAVVEVHAAHQGWRSVVTSKDLHQLLLYFHTVIRRETREQGMMVIVDGRKTPPPPQVYRALATLQEHLPHAVRCVVLFVDKDSSHYPEMCHIPGIQSEVVTSPKALCKLVDVSQLSTHLDGTLPYRHSDWLDLHQKLYWFVSELHDASGLLLAAIRKLQENHTMDTVQSVQQCIVGQRTLMRDVLEDSRLVGLQREGGSILARLRKESDLKYPQQEDFSNAVDSVSSLYNRMEEQAHVLVQRSNTSLEHLEHLLRLREMEGHFTQMREWFDIEGERHLVEAEEVEESKERVEQVLSDFTAFLIEANDRKHHFLSLVTEADRLPSLLGPFHAETEAFKGQAHSFLSGLEIFLSRAEACCQELQTAVVVLDFCEQATALARECKEYLEQSRLPHLTGITTTTSPHHSPAAAGPGWCHYSPPDLHDGAPPDLQRTGGDPELQAFQRRFLPFSQERFQEVGARAGGLRGSRGTLAWNLAWLQCQEARQWLEESVREEACPPHQQRHTGIWYEHHGNAAGGSSDADKTAPPGGPELVLQSITDSGPLRWEGELLGVPQWEGGLSGAADSRRRRQPILGNSSTEICSFAMENSGDTASGAGLVDSPDAPHRRQQAEGETQRRQSTTRGRSERDTAAISQANPVGCQWFPWGRGLGGRSASEESCAAAASPVTLPTGEAVAPATGCSHHGQPSCRVLREAQSFQISRHGSFCSEELCPTGPPGLHASLPCPRGEGESSVGAFPADSNTLRLQCVMEELVLTEREYVRSLGYILTHYRPLLDRPDVPQDLRGKRAVVFGNLEAIHGFHSRRFLPELEACCRDPALVARCFLTHSESFGLYALYSKNKPQSDTLILHRRHDVFKRKQQELGDLMDLPSYLLRPVQRLSKYSLLLQDMLALATPPSREGGKACDVGSGTEEIRAAADLVRFQMRRGNDLLTMDAIQHCDVNLKEQGELLRQDEFTVLFRRKKCARRVFLFQHLILFSKTRRTDVGNDVYVYKHSIKTCEVGLTRDSAVGPLCFEIWFRRRKSGDTYTLRAATAEVKRAWTGDLEGLLWKQAAHSREQRLQERLLMGIGRKPFMDIQPNEAAICDSTNSYRLATRVPVACCSHRRLDCPRPHSIGSGSTASTAISQSSSSSGRGSLPPVGYPGNPSQGAEASADNRLNRLHLHQHHLHHREAERRKQGCHLPPTSPRCPSVDSTESSEECVFSGSEHSCLSAIGGEVVDFASSFASQGSKLHPSLSRAPSLRTNGSPALARRKPCPAPFQGSEIIIGKSTEV